MESSSRVEVMSKTENNQAWNHGQISTALSDPSTRKISSR